MKVISISLLAVALSTAALAQLTPGVAVAKGDPFPIITDFNHDGLDDLVNERNVMLSNGNGFDAARDFGLRDRERVIGVLDINGDRIPDLLTQIDPLMMPPSVGGGTSGARTYFVYVGNPSGKYAKPLQIQAGPPPYIADVNADGKDDLIVMNYIWDGIRSVGEDVTVMVSRGDGTFESLPSFRIPPDPQGFEQRLQTADLNHDGLPDIVMRMPEDLVILLGTGGGRFTVVDHFVPETMEYGWWSTQLGDIDGDGNTDIVMVGWRRVHVLFGDGHGAFPRMATTSIAKLHDATVPSWYQQIVDVDKLNQPRDLALGHFTRTDKTQIAAGMSEGDIVVFDYEDGALKEVARTPTEFWATDIRSGHFRSGNTSDIYAIGTLIWGGDMPGPRVFNGSNSQTAADASHTIARNRAARFGNPTSTLDFQISGDCFATSTERWVFNREGIFGTSSPHEGTKIEALFDGPNIYYRLTAPYLQMPLSGELSRNADGTFSGTANAVVTCGVRTISITATPQ